MRKESLKKDGGSKSGNAEDGDMENGTENEATDAVALNGDADAAVDPLGGADGANSLDVAPKKKGKKGKDADTVVEVSVPSVLNSDEKSNGDDAPAEEADDYEVEEIVSHKVEKKIKYYLVQWKGFSADDNTWEPESSLSCPEIIEKYLESVKDAKTNDKVATKKKKAEPKKAAKPAAPASKKSKRSAAKPKKDKEEEEDYEVEDIVDHKTERGKTVFLIRWKGWGADSDTWEPEATLSCPDIVKKYKKNNMDSPAGKGKKADAKKGGNAKKEDKEEDYEVQEIVGEKQSGSKKLYLVRWKGYGASSDTWEPESSLSCPELIKKFKDSQAKKSTKSPAVSKSRGGTKRPKYKEVDEEDADDDEEKIVVRKRKPLAAKESDEEEDYEVEDIVDDKMEKGKKMYLVKWKGYSASTNTWEPESSLSCPEIIKKYKAKKSSPPAKKTTKPAAGSKKATSAASPAKKTKTKAEKKAVAKEADEEEADWEVEEVVDVKYNDNGSKDFLIRWKGCKPSSDTWEPEKNLDCTELIDKFMNKVDDDAEVIPKKKSRKA